MRPNRILAALAFVAALAGPALVHGAPPDQPREGHVFLGAVDASDQVVNATCTGVPALAKFTAPVVIVARQGLKLRSDRMGEVLGLVHAGAQLELHAVHVSGIDEHRFAWGEVTAAPDALALGIFPSLYGAGEDLDDPEPLLEADVDCNRVCSEACPPLVALRPPSAAELLEHQRLVHDIDRPAALELAVGTPARAAIAEASPRPPWLARVHLPRSSC